MAVKERLKPRDIAFGLAGLATGAVVTLLATEWSAANVTAAATIILVGVTAAYAYLVNSQVDVMRQQGVDRGRARAEQAAWTALEAIYGSGIRPGAPPEAFLTAEDVFHALEQRAPFVETVDAEVADRMRTAGVVAWMSSWPRSSFASEAVDRDVVRLRAAAVVERCSHVLQQFLTSRPLPSWQGLPRYSEGSGMGVAGERRVVQLSPPCGCWVRS